MIVGVTDQRWNVEMYREGNIQMWRNTAVYFEEPPESPPPLPKLGWVST